MTLPGLRFELYGIVWVAGFVEQAGLDTPAVRYKFQTFTFPKVSADDTDTAEMGEICSF